jgi:hypothetical protein
MPTSAWIRFNAIRNTAQQRTGHTSGQKVLDAMADQVAITESFGTPSPLKRLDPRELPATTD